MTKAEELFHKIAAGIPDATESKMFGALCIKAPNGKSGVMLWKEYMIFKLEGAAQASALGLAGAKIFDPMGGRPMGGWVQLSDVHAGEWEKYAGMAMEHVRNIEVAPKQKKTKR